METIYPTDYLEIDESLIQDTIGHLENEQDNESDNVDYDLINANNLDEELQYNFIKSSSFDLFGVSVAEFAEWKSKNQDKIKDLINKGVITDEKDIRLRQIAAPEIQRERKVKEAAKQGMFSVPKINIPKIKPPRPIFRKATATIGTMVADKPIEDEEKGQPAPRVARKGEEEEEEDTKAKYLGIDKTTQMVIGGVAIVLIGTFIYFKFIRK